MKTTHVEQFAALGQEDRLEIFRLLVRAGPAGCCVNDIKDRLRMPGSTLSHHLDALTRCGLLTGERCGRFICYAVDWKSTAQLISFLTKDCCADLHSSLWRGGRQGAPFPAISGDRQQETRNGRKTDQGRGPRNIRA